MATSKTQSRGLDMAQILGTTQIKTFDLFLMASALAALFFLLPADRESANFDKSANSSVSAS